MTRPPVGSVADFIAMMEEQAPGAPDDALDAPVGRQPDQSYVFPDGSFIDPATDETRWPPTVAGPPRAPTALWCILFRAVVVKLTPYEALQMARMAEIAYPEAAGLGAWIWDTYQSLGRYIGHLRPKDPR